MRKFVLEFRDFLKNEKKSWLLPIVLVVVVLAVLLVLTQTDLGPFIYSKF
jgi:cell division protein FtsW (lipid II flippase)